MGTEIKIFLNEDESVDLKVRNFFETYLKLTEEEDQWLNGGESTPNASFISTLRDFPQWMIGMPSDDEDFLSRFQDAPERIKTLVLKLTAKLKENNILDRGYLLIIGE